MYREVKALKVSYISRQNLRSPPSLMCLELMIAFSCKALLGQNRKRHIFSLLKLRPAGLRKLADAHESVVWQ